MKLFAILLLLVLVAVGAISALNWATFVTPSEISLGVTSVTVPLGALLLGFMVVITLLFLAYVIYLQTSALLETRRYSRELQSSRDLADKAEDSRFTELRADLQSEVLKLATLNESSKSTVVNRIDQLESQLVTTLENSGNTLAAYIGELDDRMQTNSRRIE